MIVLILTVGFLYWYTEQQGRSTNAAIEEQRKAMLAQQAQADSVRRAAAAEYRRLQQELDNARSSAAPSGVLDSLRQALSAASKRTEALAGALKRAESQMAAQLAAGDSARKAAQSELSRLRSDLSRASAADAQASSAMLDSLRSAVRDAERKAQAVDAQVRGLRSVNLAAVAEANGSAIGLVLTADEEGSGFVLTPSGYFVTNRHVVESPEGKRAEFVTIIMADQRVDTQRRADIMAVAPANGPDLAIVKIRGYKGPYIRRVDWTNAHAHQGESAAMIGFPSGTKYAFKESLTPRTTMSAGILSKVTPDLIQFEGFSLPGSSGSPVFNGEGEIVAVHRASNEGIKFAVPIPLLVPLLPADAKRELGLP